MSEHDEYPGSQVDDEQIAELIFGTPEEILKLIKESESE